MGYATQMEAARKGIITPQMETVAKKEDMDVHALAALIASGRAVIPANKNHSALDANGIGARLLTKVNVNIGAFSEPDEDKLCKMRLAIEAGAHSLMDLSSGADTRPFRRKLIAQCPVMVGTVPIYEAATPGQDLKDITKQQWLDIVKTHAEDGIDFLTIHVGLNRRTADRYKRHERLMDIVSRGGLAIFEWMEVTGNENPFYEQFEKVLDICRAYDVTLSLGDACRPGCIEDATDISQIEELVILGELTQRAWAKDVQVIIEGSGHMPLNQIPGNIRLQDTLCKGAPFYCLGPFVTDIAPGYEHITAAIGAASAAANGAAFLCCVTPAWEIKNPDLNELKEGLIAARIAAHSADIAKGIRTACKWDYEMSTTLRDHGLRRVADLAIDPYKARAYVESQL